MSCRSCRACCAPLHVAACRCVGAVLRRRENDPLASHRRSLVCSGTMSCAHIAKLSIGFVDAALLVKWRFVSITITQWKLAFVLQFGEVNVCHLVSLSIRFDLSQALVASFAFLISRQLWIKDSETLVSSFRKGYLCALAVFALVLSVGFSSFCFDSNAVAPFWYRSFSPW